MTDGVEGHIQIYQELQRSSSFLRPSSWPVTKPGRGRWDSPFSWLRCGRISKSHGCKNHESCSVSFPRQGQSQHPLPFTLQTVTGALTENAVIPDLSYTIEVFPSSSLTRVPAIIQKDQPPPLPIFIIQDPWTKDTPHLKYGFISNSSSRNFPSLSALSFPGQGHSTGIEKQLHFFFLFFF